MSSHSCAYKCRFLAAYYRTYEIMSSERIKHIQDTRAARLMHNFGPICKTIDHNQNMVALLVAFILMVF